MKMHFEMFANKNCKKDLELAFVCYEVCDCFATLSGQNGLTFYDLSMVTLDTICQHKFLNNRYLLNMRSLVLCIRK